MVQAAQYPSRWAGAAADRATAEAEAAEAVEEAAEAEAAAAEAAEEEAAAAEAAEEEAAEAEADVEAELTAALTPLATRWLCRAAIHSRATRGCRRNGTARRRCRSVHDDRDAYMHPHWR
jgi:hypothetical protein